jgi:hypothetical protein
VTAREEIAEEVLDAHIQRYLGEPVRKDLIRVSILLEMLFLFAYLVIYVAPYLSVYSMIGLFVVAVLAGIKVRVREMMRVVG